MEAKTKHSLILWKAANRRLSTLLPAAFREDFPLNPLTWIVPGFTGVQEEIIQLWKWTLCKTVSFMLARDIEPWHSHSRLVQTWHMASRLNCWDANACGKKTNNTTATAEGAHCWLRPSMSLLYIPLHQDNAKCLEEWPEMNARCTQGPSLTLEGQEILFDSAQRISVSQVNPAQSSIRVNAASCLP